MKKKLTMIEMADALEKIKRERIKRGRCCTRHRVEECGMSGMGERYICCSDCPEGVVVKCRPGDSLKN